MTMIDWALIALIAISTVFSVWRGGTREVLTLLTWVLAGALAYFFQGPLAHLLSQYIESPAICTLIAALSIILVVVIIGTLLSTAIASGITRIGLSFLDKLFGLVFGGIRGLAIILLVVIGLQYTEIPAEPMWKESKLLPLFEVAGQSIKEWLSANGGHDLKVKLEGYMQNLSAEEQKQQEKDQAAHAKPGASTSTPTTGTTSGVVVKQSKAVHEESTSP